MTYDKPNALLIANAVADYLEEELGKSTDTFIPVHREIAVTALGIVLAAADSLKSEARTLQ